MDIITEKIKKSDVKHDYLNHFEKMSKGVVDIDREIIALDAEMHADLESLLIEDGSKQEDLWGFNILPFNKKRDFIEYTSLINIRPHQDNYAIEIQDKKLRNRVKKVIYKLIDHET